MISVHKTLLGGSPEDIRQKAEELARGLGHREYLAGTWLRELAVELASHGDLRVSVVTYEARSQGLEVVLTGAPHCDGIMIDHNKIGDRCQITLERWVRITDEPGVASTVSLIRSVLSASARPVEPRA